MADSDGVLDGTAVSSKFYNALAEKKGRRKMGLGAEPLV